MGVTNFIGIIPARYASQRLPGKPLLKIGTKTIIERVYENVSQSLDTVLVATDDERIYNHVLTFNGKAVMTRQNHICGTDRCLEAYLHYAMQIPYNTPLSNLPNNWQTYCNSEDVIINIQGDEPFVSAQHINAIKTCFDDTLAPVSQIATLICPFNKTDTWETLSDPNTPKCLIKTHPGNSIAKILMFSRSVIPYLRDIPKEDWTKQNIHYRHIGMYAYKANVLSVITQLPPSSCEMAEKLEQLRWIENGYNMYAAIINDYERGIDTQADLERARKIINHSE